MKIKFNLKKKSPAATADKDEKSMAILMGAFRDLVARRVSKELPGEVTMLSPHRTLCATTHGKAYLVGKRDQDDASLVIVQGPSGTTAPVTKADMDAVVSHPACVGKIHLFAEAFEAGEETPQQIEPHPMAIDPFRFIPDMYRKAKVDRALLSALHMLGKKAA